MWAPSAHGMSIQHTGTIIQTQTSWRVILRNYFTLDYYFSQNTTTSYMTIQNLTTRWLWSEIWYKWQWLIWCKVMLPPPTNLLSKPTSATCPIYIFKWPFLWHLKVSGLKKDLLQRGHTNPTPKCTFCTCAQMVAWEVDGPSLQPSTWHL